jgi:hypothetical protein
VTDQQKGKRFVIPVPADLQKQTPEERAAFVKEVAKALREALKPGDTPTEAK